MKNRIKAGYCGFLLVMITATVLLSGCGGEDVMEIYPPVVFKPIPGEAGGGPVNDNLTVSVVENISGDPLENAVVLIHQGEPYELKATETTGPDGVASFAGKGITGPVTVTVSCNTDVAYDTISMIGINAARLVIPMERRKDPEDVRTALTFPGLDAGDEKLLLFRNDVPYEEKIVKSGKLENDPVTLKVSDRPLAFSAMAMDATENTTKYGFVVEPDGPLPAATPAMLNLVRVSQDNVKICNGSIENPPANLDEPSDGWELNKRIIFQVFGNGGMAGQIVAGFANISNEFTYQAFIVNTQGIEKMRLEVTAKNRTDAWTEMTTAFKHFSFVEAPAKMDFNFIDAPKNLQIATSEEQTYPDLIWESTEGNVTEVEIFHADYNYHWTIFVFGEDTQRLHLPPLELGSSGAMLADEIYRFRVTKWLVPGMDFGNWTFQGLNETVTHRSQSTLVKFLVKGREEE
ncbi:MAG TPA: hypothetical protein PLV45_04425 [bacterium]|nr:hypothetical protein [bacterium]